MRGPEADRAALEDMVSYIERVLRHVPSRESLADEIVRHAALWELAIIGEAANRSSARLREQHPSVPWRLVIDFRNFILHAYDRINVDRVWDAVRELPELEVQVRAILDELPE